ncbi:hypothetical protein CAPTEDRAFT_190342 [Capitella teleta]|uniref:Ig-like domain-containing protein n=1 Tax=Capitella teleta TaxID=283909 RepID=R7V5M3_CAPTE|nr:hypothetical protein CAPTEDRAFT_190342 [Capitella teleta]|eukprot:ELU13757.1 hypothetical protein CAPTEDRAFT_190342 [Capitella teleta]
MKCFFPGTIQTFLFFFVHTLLTLLWPDSRVEADASGPGGGGPAGGRGPGPGGGIGLGGDKCPHVCFCNVNSKIVYCSRRGLPAIPTSIPRDTLQLNLNGNVFQSTGLERSNFSRWSSLEHLYMSECGIESIAVDTFRDLSSLEWLDISNNRIKIVQDYTFRGLQLQHLFLNGNRHIGLQPKAMEGLTTSGLYLHDCSLSRLHPEVLTPLNHTLRYLWLHGNELDRLERRLSPLFSSLSHLRLGSNPLHCNCELLWLKEFYDRHGDKFKGATSPSCLTPQRLRGKFFNEMAMTDFRCQAPVFNNIDALFDSFQGRLKCTATGDPAPTLYWIQPNGRTTKYIAPPDEDARKNEGLLTLTKPAGSDQELAGMYICVANNEAGNVTLTINVSWPHSRIVTYKTVAGDPGISSTQRTLFPDLNELLSKSSTRKDDISVTLTPDTKVGQGPQTPSSDTRLHEQHNNHTATRHVVETGGAARGASFSLSELIGAIIGTHLCTLLLCLIVIPIYYRKKWKPSTMMGTNCRQSSMHKLPPIPPESVYLNGLGHHPANYMDIPTTKR